MREWGTPGPSCIACRRRDALPGGRLCRQCQTDSDRFFSEDFVDPDGWVDDYVPPRAA